LSVSLRPVSRWVALELGIRLKDNLIIIKKEPRKNNRLERYGEITGPKKGLLKKAPLLFIKI